MRTLLEIIESAKDGNMPSHEECYYAMLTYEAMFNMDHRHMLDEFTKEVPSSKMMLKMKAENSFRMYQGALNKSPKEWLGPNWDPATPEYQRFRKIAEKVFDKVVNQVKEDKKQ